jgi:hypothetical protein
MKILKETLSGCINWLGSGLPRESYYVIESPHLLTGICFRFDTEEQASYFIDLNLF